MAHRLAPHQRDNLLTFVLFPGSGREDRGSRSSGSVIYRDHIWHAAAHMPTTNFETVPTLLQRMSPLLALSDV